MNICVLYLQSIQIWKGVTPYLTGSPEQQRARSRERQRVNWICTIHLQKSILGRSNVAQSENLHAIWSTILILADSLPPREAPLLSGVLNLKCSPSSSFFVLRSSENNWFLRRGNGGSRIVLPTGSLTHRFFGVRKVDPPKLALATGIGRFRDPFFGRKKVTFLEKSSKSGHGILPGGKGAKITLLWTDVGGVTNSNVSKRIQYYAQPTRASRPCRARCI